MPASPKRSAVRATEGQPLGELELAVLELERRWWQRSGEKELAIREQFGMTPARYYQVLNALLDSADALRHDPMLVGRLRRLRDARAAARRSRGFRRANDPD